MKLGKNNELCGFLICPILSPLSLALSLVARLLVVNNSRELSLCDLSLACLPAARPALATGSWVTPRLAGVERDEQ